MDGIRTIIWILLAALAAQEFAWAATAEDSHWYADVHQPHSHMELDTSRPPKAALEQSVSLSTSFSTTLLKWKT
jgi:hypothetical protein